MYGVLRLKRKRKRKAKKRENDVLFKKSTSRRKINCFGEEVPGRENCKIMSF